MLPVSFVESRLVNKHTSATQLLDPVGRAWQPRLKHPRADVPFDAIKDAQRCVRFLHDEAGPTVRGEGSSVWGTPTAHVSILILAAAGVRQSCTLVGGGAGLVSGARA